MIEITIGNSTNYSFDVQIKRENLVELEEEAEDESIKTVTKLLGVHRVRKLGLRIVMTIGGKNVYMVQELDNKDTVTTTVAVNADVTSVSVQVVDMCDVATYGGSANWATGSTTRSNTLTLTPGTDRNNPGFKFNGAMGYINDQLRAATALGDLPENISGNKSKSGATIGAQNLTDSGLSTSVVANGTGNAVSMRRWALANILAMYQSLPEKRDLTWDEMQEAIHHGTVWDANANGWTNGFTGTYSP